MTSLQNAVRSYHEAPAPRKTSSDGTDPRLEQLRNQLLLAGLVLTSCDESPAKTAADEGKSGEKGKDENCSKGPAQAGVVTKAITDADTNQPRETSSLDFSSSTRTGTPTRKRNSNRLLCYD